MLVLLIDDNIDLLDLTTLFLKRINDKIKLETAVSVEEAYKKLKDKKYKNAL